MHKPTTPTSFLQGYPSSPAIGVTPPEAWKPGSIIPEPAAPPEPRLTVRANGDVTLTKALLSAIPHLKRHAPVDLVPPLRRGGTWHLDTRPFAPRRLSHSETERSSVARFCIPPLKKEHLLQVAAQAGPGRKGTGTGTGTLGTVGTRGHLTFALGPEAMEEVCVTDGQGKRICQMRGTGYFVLLPVRETVQRTHR